jgi:hypothetical protein
MRRGRRCAAPAVFTGRGRASRERAAALGMATLCEARKMPFYESASAALTALVRTLIFSFALSAFLTGLFLTFPGATDCQALLNAV